MNTSVSKPSHETESAKNLSCGTSVTDAKVVAPTVPSHTSAIQTSSGACTLEQFSISDLKTAFEQKRDELQETVLNSRFRPPRNGLEKEERRKAFGPEISLLAQESRSWMAEWSVRSEKGDVSLTLVWSIHDDNAGFGIEIFLPNKKQVLSLGAGLEYAAPLGENRYIVTDISDRALSLIISHFAFAVPTPKSKVAPSEYLVVNEKTWRAGPAITWRPVTALDVENLRKDAARKDQLDEPR